jgi:hypothetical protein
MFIFPKKDIIPIIIPPVCFLDIFENTSSFFEMNPSMFINENGNVKILIRYVNYLKFNDKKFTLLGNKSTSLYFIIKGNIFDNKKLNLDNYEFNSIQHIYNLPIFNSYWLGLEDIRFLNENKIIVTVPELNEGGKPSIFKADIDYDNNIISNFNSCYPNIIEKNWMPYQDKGLWKVIYSLSPFKIKSIENNDLQEINISEIIRNQLEEYHGSTNGIYFCDNLDERLFLIHVNREKTYHRWLLFNLKTHDIKLSEEFVFFNHSYIEFTCSLCKYKDRVFVSLGVNDNKAFIIELTIDDIRSSFHIPLPTIITMLYDIRSIENDSNERNRKLESYIDFSKKFLLKLPYPIIIFIDENIETFNAIYNFRKELNLLEKTVIIKKNFTNTYFYKDLSRLQELQDKFHILNGDIQHETPHYIILNNNKFDCIDNAIELNPFGSTHFLWMDFGINHIAETTERIHKWIFDIPDKIKQLCINPYTENTSQKEQFQLIYHNMAGGLFSGSKNNLKKYSELFKQKTEQIYNDDWYQIDEAVMTMVQRENPELFDLFYGDYQGIVSNYIYPIHNIDLILRGSQKCLDFNRIKEAFDILVYCLRYFEINPNCIHFYNFIQQNITTNYFFNNKLLLDEVIKLINIKKQSTNIQDIEQINSLLENNRVNIEFYQNKEKIL